MLNSTRSKIINEELKKIILVKNQINIL